MKEALEKILKDEVRLDFTKECIARKLPYCHFHRHPIRKVVHYVHCLAAGCDYANINHNGKVG